MAQLRGFGRHLRASGLASSVLVAASAVSAPAAATEGVSLIK